jgi:hypothetical protein
MKKEWQKLSQSEQKDFLDRAAFLIDKGYVIDTSLKELAKNIYAKNAYVVAETETWRS